jgi:hypothetical protein
MFEDPTCLLFPSGGIAEVPLIFEPQLLRCVAAGAGKYPLTVLLDTGTDPSAIDLNLAKRLGLRLGDFAFGQDALSNRVPYAETIVPWLRLGDLQLHNLFALALDLSAAPFNVDMVLGYNVLCQLILHIDYVRGVVRLGHPDMGLCPSLLSGITMPLTFFEHFPAVAGATLGEDVDLPLVTIDTGSNGGLTLGPDLAARMGLRPDAETVTVAQGAGFSNTSRDILCSQASLLRLGSVDLHNIELDTPGSGTGDLCRSGRANMGNRILARFSSITLDYARALCAFNPL